MLGLEMRWGACTIVALCLVHAAAGTGGALTKTDGGNDTISTILECDGSQIVYHNPTHGHAAAPAEVPVAQAANFPREFFVTEYVDASVADVPTAYAVLRAPVHTCMIQQYPGTRAFLERFQDGFPRLQVRPYAQPPNLNFYTADDVLKQRVRVAAQAAVDDVVAFLASQGMGTPASAVK